MLQCADDITLPTLSKEELKKAFSEMEDILTEYYKMETHKK